MAERTLDHAKIEPVWDSVVHRCARREADKVTGVRLKNLKTNSESTSWTPPGCSWRSGTSRTPACSRGVIDMDKDGYIIPKKGHGNERPGVFVAGDCSDRVYRQAVTAAGMGCAAAIEAERYPRGEGSLKVL